MSPFAISAAEEFGLPIALSFTIVARSFMGTMHFRALVEKGLAPLRGMKGMRLRDLPSFLRTTNPDDVLLTLGLVVSDVVHKASALVLFAFDALEQGVLTALSSMPNIPPVYTIGPIELLLNQIPRDPLNFIGYSMERRN
ncbi:unnamed protein product [Prunus armeniaca]